jgi:hypothetical protein
MITLCYMSGWHLNHVTSSPLPQFNRSRFVTICVILLISGLRNVIMTLEGWRQKLAIFICFWGRHTSPRKIFQVLGFMFRESKTSMETLSVIITNYVITLHFSLFTEITRYRREEKLIVYSYMDEATLSSQINCPGYHWVTIQICGYVEQYSKLMHTGGENGFILFLVVCGNMQSWWKQRTLS